jgi:hypothetical protein
MSALSDKVLSISVEYLGPAAKVFLERQTMAHLNGVSFDTLEGKHIPDLQKWVLISANLIIEKDKATELAARIGKLS